MRSGDATRTLEGKTQSSEKVLFSRFDTQRLRKETDTSEQTTSFILTYKLNYASVQDFQFEAKFSIGNNQLST
jgi:hypothetical protein